jgi:hypothetical protein
MDSMSAARLIWFLCRPLTPYDVFYFAQSLLYSLLKICQVFFRSLLLFSETNFLEESLRKDRLALGVVIL